MWPCCHHRPTAASHYSKKKGTDDSCLITVLCLQKRPWADPQLCDIKAKS